MTSSESLDELRTAAASWVVRANGGELSDEELVAFDEWLSASPEHQWAYDQALTTWLAFEEAPAPKAERRIPQPQRLASWAAAAALGIAASVALVVYLAPSAAPAVKATTYATALGEHRSITLADGSRLDLNTATRLTVQLARNERRVILDEGEAAFTVVHDPSRPFVVVSGGGFIRDVGTEFDVRQRGEAFSVTVSHGVVQVQPRGGRGADPVTLRAGQRLERATAQSAMRVRTVAPDDDFSWRSGRLVLRNESLAEVVAELNLYYARPIRIADPELARAPISGVLLLDSQEATLRRLKLFAPFKVTVRNGDFVLQATTSPSA